MRTRGIMLVIEKEPQVTMRRRNTRLVNLVAHEARNKTVVTKNTIVLHLLSFRLAVKPYV